jgi:hypothetical protein
MQAAQQILDVIEIISDNLPRLDLYEQLHDNPHFKASLVNLFADITEFAVHAYHFFSQPVPSAYAGYAEG